MRRPSWVIAVSVIGLMLVPWGAPPCAANCQKSPTLFAYRGALFTVSAGQKPTQIASGFKSPSNITWAPECGHYAFIDSGSLWVGTQGVKPRKVDVPGEVRRRVENGLPGYRWSPNGEAIAATAWTSGCNRQHGAGMPLDEGNVYVARAPAFTAKALTQDCKNYVIGWSDNGKLAAIDQQVLPPCAVSEPICATGNIVAVNPHTGSCATLVKAQYLRRKGLDSPNVVKWNTHLGVVHIWAAVSQIGGLGALLAVRVPPGEILWSVESYGVTILTDGRIANLDRKVTDLEKTGFNWEWEYRIVSDGKVAEEYAPQPTSGGGEQGVISPSGRFVGWQPEGSRSEVRFGTKTDAQVWGRRLPAGFQSVDEAWTPSDHLVLQAYKKKTPGSIFLGVWAFDPIKETSAKLFEVTSPLKPGVDPNGFAYRALSLARWAR